MQEEYESLMENEIWMLVDRPRDKKTVKIKWIFRTKHGEKGK
jgi:hypothetical protein